MGMVVMSNYEDAATVAAMLPELEVIKDYFAMTSLYDADAATPKSASATDTFSGYSGFEADKAVDGLLTTRWAADAATAYLTIQLGTTRTVSELRVAEPPQYQRVRGFTVSAQSGDSWQPVATGTTIGPGLAIPFSPVSASAVRLEITASTGAPTIAEAWVK